MSAPDLRDPVERQKEAMRVSRDIVLRRAVDIRGELQFLIVSTPTGDAKNSLCDAYNLCLAVSEALEKYCVE